MSAEAPITKENLDTYLKELAKQFRKLNGKAMPAEITLIGGASILEKVFNQKGMGWLALKSLNGRDYPQESAIVLFTALMGLGTKLLTDIFYKIVDPRIEYE